MLPLGLAAMRPLASLTMTWSEPLDRLILFVGDDSPVMYLSATIMSPRCVGVIVKSSIISDFQSKEKKRT